VLLFDHDETDEGAEQREDESEFQAEVDEARVVRTMEKKVPGIEEDECAAEEAALLENLESLFFLCAIELPLAGQAE